MYPPGVLVACHEVSEPGTACPGAELLLGEIPMTYGASNGTIHHGTMRFSWENHGKLIGKFAMENHHFYIMGKSTINGNLQ